jgi:precorrin-2 dehydrogenase/sirohydrochlorin ferrochelatase/precorrin-6A/cobalt-precorrin-6A reductase
MTQSGILIFGGTTEGRALFEGLLNLGVEAGLQVATDYGKMLVEGETLEGVASGRLDIPSMLRHFEQRRPELVVDATHPYAVEVTKNLKAACQSADIPYLRLNRAASKAEGVIEFETVEAAAAWLDQQPGGILSTIGSKGLRHLTGIRDFESRIFTRILPLPEALEEAVAQGFKGSQLICMQGPFTMEMNLAMLRQFKCKYLLTKDSGSSGGFEEKLEAAREAGARVVLVGRPDEVPGLSYEDVLKLILSRESARSPQKSLNYFPMFVDMRGKRVLVVGGGKIAERRIETLLKFDCEITVVAPKVSDKLQAFCCDNRLKIRSGRYSQTDLDGVDVALAVTNDREVNRRIGLEAKASGIPVSVADAQEECTFYFPAVVEHGDIVLGLSSQGRSHRGVSAFAKKLRWILNHEN